MTRGQLVLLEILWGLSWVSPPQKTLPLLFPTLQKEPPCCSTLSQHLDEHGMGYLEKLRGCLPSVGEGSAWKSPGAASPVAPRTLGGEGNCFSFLIPVLIIIPLIWSLAASLVPFPPGK